MKNIVISRRNANNYNFLDFTKTNIDPDQL